MIAKQGFWSEILQYFIKIGYHSGNYDSLYDNNLLFNFDIVKATSKTGSGEIKLLKKTQTQAGDLVDEYLYDI